jgi:hypothetical protein
MHARAFEPKNALHLAQIILIPFVSRIHGREIQDDDPRETMLETKRYHFSFLVFEIQRRLIQNQTQYP